MIIYIYIMFVDDIYTFAPVGSSRPADWPRQKSEVPDPRCLEPRCCKT